MNPNPNPDRYVCACEWICEVSYFCDVPPAGEAGEAAAEEREDSIQGPLRVGQGEEQPAAPTRPQRQQWSWGRCVVREGGLEGWTEGGETHNQQLLTLKVIVGLWNARLTKYWIFIVSVHLKIK